MLDRRFYFFLLGFSAKNFAYLWPIWAVAFSL